MQLTHEFTVPAPLDDTWRHFNDIEAVASCFPGASVTSVQGDEFQGTCKVKLGPIAMQYAGAGTFLEKDTTAHRFVIQAKGKDKRGNGTAGATVTATLAGAGESTTAVTVLTDLSVTGKPAQLGARVMQDVSDKLLGQFVSCLESRLGGAVEAAAAQEAAVAAEEATVAARAAASAAPVSPTAVPEPAEVDAPLPEEENVLDLGTTVLPVLAKAYWKQALGAVLVLLVLLGLRRRLRRRGS